MRRLLTPLLAILVALLAACGNDTDNQAVAPDSDADQAGMMMEIDDETFLGAMIEHHEGAVEMAEIALERAERDEIRQMAREIIDAQETEIDQMEHWMSDWYGGGHGDHGVSHEEMGMDLDMDEFRDAEPFDEAFISEMIVHHEGAIEMARAVLESTERDELREMAEEIIRVQEVEIEQMREWHQDWFGN
jgi:uncharacterized protein (DUF305 family)